MEPARVTVSRNASDDVRMRQLEVSIDGRHAATLLYGDTMTRDIEPGRHRLRIHNTLVWKTVHFDLGAGQHARFTTVNRAGFGTYSMLGLLGAGPLYVTIRRDG